jgi:hypothetical protein
MREMIGRRGGRRGHVHGTEDGMRSCDRAGQGSSATVVLTVLRYYYVQATRRQKETNTILVDQLSKHVIHNTYDDGPTYRRSNRRVQGSIFFI